MLALLTPLLAKWGVSQAEAWAKRLEPVLIALMILAAAGAAYWWASSRGAASQRTKDANAMAIMTHDRDTWIAAFHASDANFRAAIGIVNDQNEQARARARSYDASKAADATNTAANNAAWEKSQNARKALSDIAANGKSGCSASSQLMEALDAVSQ